MQIGDIHTIRYCLRPISIDDIAEIAAIGTEGVFRTVPEIDAPFDAEAWVHQKVNGLSDDCVRHVIEDYRSKRISGYLQIIPIVEREGCYLSVGYWIGEEFWGQNRATEALLFALKALSQNIESGSQLIPVHAKVLRQNLASKRVLEKCCFLPSGPPNGGPLTDGVDWFHWRYSATKYHRETRSK